VLVIPKKHVTSLSASTPEDQNLLGHLQGVIRDLAKKSELESFRVVTNNGRGVGQSVDHLHYHVLAGRRMSWPPG
jgi:histidine triad (HIT) family protein